MRLEIENIKRLEAVEITPTGELVIIGGENGAGKSSVLDSIEMALAGKGSVPAEPVHRGEEEGYVVLDLGDLVVQRKFKTNDEGVVRTSLKVENADGEMKSPQAILDRLTGALTFDPLDFTRMEPKVQRQVLSEIAGVDLAAFKTEYDKVFAARRDVNRDLKSAKARADAMPYHEDAPLERIDTGALLVQYKGAIKYNEMVQLKQSSIASSYEAIADWQEKIDEIQDRIEKVTEAIAATEVELKQLKPKDTESLAAEVGGADAANRKLADNEQSEGLRTEVKTLDAKSKAMTADLKAIDERRAKTVGEAAMPVPGLDFSDDGVLFSDLPFEQASQAEQLRISCAIGLATHPDLKVLLIRDGSLLDANSMGLLAGLAAEADAQLWVERVGDGDETAVVIEEGHLR